MSRPTPTPYEISISDDLLNWINDRVKTTRLPPGKTLPATQTWSFGLPIEIATRIHKYWTTQYDWRRVEAQLNTELKQYTLPITEDNNNLTIHFVHHRSNNANAIPLLFLHGWPGSFLEVRKIIPLLTNPINSSDQAYHVVAPSLSGYGFSSYPSTPFSPSNHASVMHKLMLALGYDKYIAQGGDWGSMIGRLMATDFPEHCVALHLNMVVATLPSVVWNPLRVGKVILAFISDGVGVSEYEWKLMQRAKWWIDDEHGYMSIQGTKPQTISYPLTDSPFGMLCWIRDKLHHLVDDDFEWDDEDVITSVMPYIINGTPGHAEIYKAAQGAKEKEQFTKALFDKIISAKVPVGCSIFPKDACYAPRWWAEVKVAQNITFWKEHEKGGHFASLEKPNELVQDIRTFTKSVDLSMFR